MKYSIWFIPPEPLYSRLKVIIKKLSEDYGGPLFEPHSTLLGDIEIELGDMEKKVKKLAQAIDRLDLNTGEISFSTTYFQSVFVRIKSKAELMQLNLEAKKIFEVPNNVFMPHSSLLYGEHDMSTREKAAVQVDLPQTDFTIREFVITPSTKDPNDWIHAATIPFNK